MISKGGTPPRHRLLDHLDNYKQCMPDHVYKSLADGIASECSPTPGMHKITYLEMCDAAVWHEDGEPAAPMQGHSEAVMKEVEMPLASFLFSFCNMTSDLAAKTANHFINKLEWFPRSYHSSMMHDEDVGGCMQTSVTQTIIILSVSEI